MENRLGGWVRKGHPGVPVHVQVRPTEIGGGWVFYMGYGWLLEPYQHPIGITLQLRRL